MKRTIALTVLLSAMLLTSLASVAHAGVVEACGNVTLASEVQCEVEPPGLSCTTMCKPINMEISCAKELFTECHNECTLTVTQEEIQVCANTCVTECQANPGSFNCTSACGVKCSGDCSAKCSASANHSQCMASCNASCSGYCGMECQAVLPSMTCEQKCQPTCKGVMVARTNMDCQLQCQTVERYTSCSTKMVGGCETDCQSQDGAIFCDGQFVDYAQNFQNCVDALKNLKISVEVGAKFDVQGCSLGGQRAAAGGAGILILVLGALFIWHRRQRRQG